MKKLFLALSTAALVFGLGACTSKKSSSASGKTSTSTSGSQSQTSTDSQSQSSSSSEQGGGGGAQNGHGPAGSELASWYLVGEGTLFSADWQISGGVQLYTNPENVNDKGCILGLTVAVGDKFKVTDGADIWFGYEKVNDYADPSNKGLTSFQGSDDGFGGQNFECIIAGTYDMYVNPEGVFWIQDAA